MPSTAVFKYIDSSLTTQSRSIQVISVRGFDDPDLVQFVPPVQNNLVDGSIETQFKGFRRVLTFDCGVLSDDTDRRFILAWNAANTRSIVYVSPDLGSEEIIVTLDYNHGATAFEYNNNWINDFIGGKQFIIQIVENAIRRTWYNYVPASGVDVIYIAKKIKVTGTQASPQTFQTNSGALATDATGQVFPAMSLVSWAISVICNGVPYQETQINQVGAITNVGTDISFQLAVSDAGNPSGDGFFYTDLLICLEAIP